MTIESAEYRNGCLILNCSPADGLKFVYGFKRGDYDIAPKKKKRSNDANAYAWALIQQIAARLRIPPVEVYRNAILNTGGVTKTILCMADEAVQQFTESWEAGHLGRQVETFPSNRRGFTNVMVIYGSSDYDTAQFSRFLDGLTQDAMELGIEVRDPADVASLLESWRPKR